MESKLNQHEIRPRGNPNWQPGQSGNPKGRPLGSRQKIADNLLAAFAGLVASDAATASLQNLMAEDPGKFWTIAASLLPKEVALSIQQTIPGGLTVEEFQTLKGVLGAIESARLGDVAPAEIFSFLEMALRSEFAKTIEHQPAVPALPPCPC